MKKEKSQKIGEYKVNGNIVSIIKLGATYKSQTSDNKGRFIHVSTIREPHIDNLEKRDENGKHQHIAIAELKTISIKDPPETVPVPWNYNDYCVGASEPDIEIEKHAGSMTVDRGNKKPIEILAGSANPSQSWY